MGSRTRLVPDPFVARILDAFLHGASAVQTHRIAFARGQHAVEHDHLALLGWHFEALGAVFHSVGLWGSTKAREDRVAALGHVRHVPEHRDHAVLVAMVNALEHLGRVLVVVHGEVVRVMVVLLGLLVPQHLHVLLMAHGHLREVSSAAIDVAYDLVAGRRQPVRRACAPVRGRPVLVAVDERHARRRKVLERELKDDVDLLVLEELVHAKHERDHAQRLQHHVALAVDVLDHR